MPFKIKKTVSSLAPSGNSVLFNGTNQYLSIPNNAAFQLGTGDFTAECWTYATSMPQSFARLLSVAGTYGGSNVGLEINISTSAAPINSIEFTINGNNTTYFRISTNSAISINTWYHVAVTRLSGTIYCFLNGVLQTSSTSGASTNINGSGGATIAAAIGGGGYWPGYVSNVRILKGTALYTASFTAPTTPLTAVASCSLLTCQSPTIIDNSGNNFAITNNNAATVSSTFTPFSASLSPFKIKKNNPNPTMLTGYGASFDGTNNIQTPSNAAFGFGTGDWTIEGWFRASTSTAMKLWRFSDNSDNLDFDLGFSTFGGLGYYNGSSSTYSSAGIITSSIWYHIAAVRKSGTASVYLNGVSVLSQTSTTNSSARSLNVGSAAGSTFNGYISNFRVLKGTALYSASFVPPTSPITSNTSCSLLTCNAATIIDGSSNAFTLTNNGNTVIPSSSFTPFSSSLIAPTNYSVAFNGSSTWLTTPSTSSLAIGTGDFTYECWAYLSSTPGQYNANAISSLVQYSPGDHGTYMGFASNLTAFATLILNNSSILTLNSGATTYALNTWHHVVLSRVGTTVSLFLNGSRVATNTNSYNLVENIVAIGKQYATTDSGVNGFTNVGVFSGYISNARVVIGGTQPYDPTSTTLTVPTTPLTAITNTKLLTCNAATIVDSSTNNLTLTNTGAATVSSTITPFSASVSNSGFKLKQVSYVRPNYMVATGGDLITTSGSYKIHTFTTVGTSSFTISNVGNTTGIECLIVAGGGGGGYGSGGGGGAGGVIYSSSYSISTGSYNVVIGDGGLGNTGSSVPTSINDGKNSTFATLTALGGGGAGGSGASTHLANSGGSGGGLGHSTGTVGTGLQPSSTSGGYGNSGALGSGSPPYNAGGGGGAGGAGSSGGGTVGRGGIGITNAFINSIQIGELSSGNYYIGGGGTGGPDSFRGSSGGLGGIGGGGGSVTANNGTTGSINTGGGGGGGANSGNQNGGNGGSGVVVIKYRYTT